MIADGPYQGRAALLHQGGGGRPHESVDVLIKGLIHPRVDQSARKLRVDEFILSSCVCNTKLYSHNNSDELRVTV